MKKTTKKDKVEGYLEDLMQTEDFTTENLMNTTVYDLFGNAELEGIGKTTLSGALNLFKKRFGLKKAGKGGLVPVKNTKKERVERYLTSLMKSPEFGVHDLMDLTVYDLFGNAELEGIGKTTLSSGISTFKKKYLKIQYRNEAIGEEPITKTIITDSHDIISDDEIMDETVPTDKAALVGSRAKVDDSFSTEEHEELEEEGEDPSFEDVFISAIVKEEKKKKMPKAVGQTSKVAAKNKTVEPVKSKTVEPVKSKTVEPVKTVGTPQILLDTDEISTIKEMISRFRRGHLNMMPVENFELIELKHALRHFGVDYKTILDHFRKSSDN